MSLDLLVKNCHIVTAEGRIGPDACLGVRDGLVASITTAADHPDAQSVVDAGGRYLVPGLVDTHIHNRSPGFEYKEDWESATRAAAAGGVTSVVGMPNTDPPVDSVEHVERKVELGERNALVDFQTYVVLTPENVSEIESLYAADVAGFKVFSRDVPPEIAPPSDGELHDAMKTIASLGARVGVHAENGESTRHYRERFVREGRCDPIDFARSRPPIAEAEGVSRVLHFAADTGCPVHIFQLSTGSAAELVADAKARQLDVTAETTPHYLWFTEEALTEKGGVASIQPPLRSRSEQRALWRVGIDGGAIDCIATDHSPHTDAEKGLTNGGLDIWKTATGFVGLETEVPAMLTFVARGALSLERWVFLHSTGPAKTWGMYPRKGSLQIGTDADFTIVDPAAEWTLDRRTLHSKNTATPWDGETFTGRVTDTFVRGVRVFGDDDVVGSPGHGRLIPVGDSEGPKSKGAASEGRDRARSTR